MCSSDQEEEQLSKFCMIEPFARKLSFLLWNFILKSMLCLSFQTIEYDSTVTEWYRKNSCICVNYVESGWPIKKLSSGRHGFGDVQN
jgi:hypothetical protein